MIILKKTCLNLRHINVQFVENTNLLMYYRLIYAQFVVGRIMNLKTHLMKNLVNI